MGVSQPKQYLKLAGKPLLFHALAALCEAPEIGAVYVVLAIDDAEWGRHDWSVLGPKLKPLFCGGPNRGDSVLNGLRAMSGEVGVDDWVLVHDAARPCLGGYHIEALMQQVSDDDVGAILAVPVADTLKRADGSGHIAATVAREGLWQAQTPQMFRYQVLRRALERARDVTDEASAVEALGLKPRLVAADMTNLKVTYPLDLKLAEWILANRGG